MNLQDALMDGINTCQCGELLTWNGYTPTDVGFNVTCKHCGQLVVARDLRNVSYSGDAGDETA